MQKKIILSLLFIGPLGFFIFLSLGDVNFKPCETFKKNVVEIASFEKDSTSFQDNINILTFLGSKPLLKDTQVYNLNATVFKKLGKYQKFQMITVYTNKDNAEIKRLQNKLAKTAGDKFYKWKFICLDSLETTTLFNSLNTQTSLDNNLASNKAFIIDKKNSQRGRTDDEYMGVDLKSYDLSSVNELKNKLLTDTENVFYEQEVSTTSRKERLGKDEK